MPETQSDSNVTETQRIRAMVAAQATVETMQKYKDEIIELARQKLIALGVPLDDETKAE